MPRFEPTLAEAHPQLASVIAEHALGERQIVDEKRLGAPMKLLLQLVKTLVSSGATKGDLLELLHAEAPDADQQIESGLRDHFAEMDINRARVLCVTPDCGNDAMWANYAESHTGCALGFRHIDELSTALLEATPVTYSDERLVVGSGLDFLLYGDSEEIRKKTLQAVCFTKKMSWSYEHEWRALTWRPNEIARQYGDYPFHAGELESVTLGARATEATESKVRILLTQKYPDAKLYRMSVLRGDLTRTLVV